MIVCVCKGVTDRDLNEAIADGCRSMEDVARCTRAGTGCGTCRATIQQRLDARPPRSVRFVLPLVAAVLTESG
jgi:assimilatory nitrate reductase electron transfer subunit